VQSIGINDKASSLRCGPNTRVELYTDSQFRGYAQAYVGDVPSFGAQNDKVRLTSCWMIALRDVTQYSSLRFM